MLTNQIEQVVRKVASRIDGLGEFPYVGGGR